jgi:hypothetical protein
MSEMDRETPFNHRQDVQLGAALRETLAPGEADAFVARVLARYDAARATPPAWDVLASWGRRGVAVAAVAALAAGLLVGRAMRPATGTIDDALGSPSGTSLPPSALLAAQHAPEASAAFASLIER